MAFQVQDRRSVGRPDAPSARPDALFRYEPPVSKDTQRAWQRMLDAAVEPTERQARLVLRWEPGDVWQPIQRWMLWLCVDPKHTEIEPWVRAALKQAHPRATGHYCGVGVDTFGRPYCPDGVKPNHIHKHKWVNGTTKVIDRQTWELHRDTGLYGTRWWTIQGHNGGHRYLWEPDELASVASRMRGGPPQTPEPGALPYAPFDARVIRQVLMERRAAQILDALNKAASADTLRAEEQAQAEQVARMLWDHMDEQAYALWHDGAEILPRYFEDTYGRMPTGSKLSVSGEAMERQEHAALHPQVGW
jgi:hypothetical protein